jgi:hypothetical protein
MSALKERAVVAVGAVTGGGETKPQENDVTSRNLGKEDTVIH